MVSTKDCNINVQDCVSSTVKILKLLNANDNVEFDYAIAA